MQIDRNLVGRLANLSRLYFTEAEMEAMQGDLSKMIGFVEKLNELDTTGVEPLMHMGQVADVYREDLAAEPMPVEKALENAREHAGQYFNVPKVIG